MLSPRPSSSVLLSVTERGAEEMLSKFIGDMRSKDLYRFWPQAKSNKINFHLISQNLMLLTLEPKKENQ